MKVTIRHLSCFLISLSVWGAITSSYAEEAKLSVVSEFSYLLDAEGSLTLKEATDLLRQQQFVSVSSELINFSIQDSVIWFAFNLSSQEEYLNIGNESTVWTATLYAKDSLSDYQSIVTYDHLMGAQQSGLLPFRTLGIPLNGAQDYLLRVSARRHRNYSLKTGDLSAMTSFLIQKEIIPVAFIAFMLCIFIYNVFLLVSTKDFIFIPYLVYVMFVAYAVPFHGGYVLFSKSWMWQGVPFYTIWTSIGYLSGAIFAIMYLDLRNTARHFAQWITFLTVMLVVVVPLLDASLMVPIGTMAKIVSITSLLFNLSLWGSAVYVWVNGLAHAKFYVTGWLFAISSMVLFILSTNGIIPYNSFVEQSFYYGFAIEAVLFAFALGDRMNILKREKRALEKAHINYITEQNRLLAKQSFMNSHMLRAPLSRIMGLTNLLKYPNSADEHEHFVGLIEKSTEEMDGIAKKMSAMLEEHGYLDQYQEDFESVKQSIYKDLEKDRK
ncbi:hypothetical protein N7E81_04530 [Reichenbachiella carrageenanivorans]|uniref:histidine kinase n=1 Tax=Reichenbachiella carrageenanivorans TaxID=2979869 RepID=A0ABY6D387_9BACT|nr:7TM diverse intracellular signaling domain-containing protein [Reichenbachiella carrageenanivorans]UXX80364.1 hypothetical protein N7E81_04530 [Reichenbachiella carrageenanivorans]